MNHTKEPWRVGFPDGSGMDEHAYWIMPVTEDGGPIVSGSDSDGWYGVDKLEDARRIVVAVNACAGIPTEELEAFVRDGGALHFDADLGRLRAENERLRTALRSAAECHHEDFHAASGVESFTECAELSCIADAELLGIRVAESEATA